MTDAWLTDSVPATLRSRGRVYGVRVQHTQTYAGSDSVSLTVLVPAVDWETLRAARKRAPRNDIAIEAAAADGTDVRCTGGRIVGAAFSRGETHVAVTVVIPRDSLVLTAWPVRHRPVCAGCHQPWPCQEAQ